MQTTSTWKPVRGYLGFYEVSDGGAVRSVDRVHSTKSRWGTPMQRVRKGKLLKPYTDNEGYRSVHLSKNGTAVTYRIARLVLTAFEGPSEGREAGHADDDPQNDRLINLFWQTRSENETQKTQHGRRPASTRGLFNAATVSVVRDIRAAGFLLQEMGALFGCHYTTLALICSEKTWRNNGTTLV